MLLHEDAKCWHLSYREPIIRRSASFWLFWTPTQTDYCLNSAQCSGRSEHPHCEQSVSFQSVNQWQFQAQNYPSRWSISVNAYAALPNVYFERGNQTMSYFWKLMRYFTDFACCSWENPVALLSSVICQVHSSKRKTNFWGENTNFSWGN